MKSKSLFLFLLFTQVISAQTFTEFPQFPPLEGVNFSSISFADVDGDNDQDVLITGRDSSGTRISKLYTNDGTGVFTEVIGTPFEGLSEGSVAFADVDGDKDQDVLITGGRSNSGDRISKLYTNDGMGVFTEMMNTPFEDVLSGSVAFADVDGDNDQDVLITGASFVNSLGVRISKLYTNDGAGTFTEMMGTPFMGVEGSSIAFADVDGDNDQDVLITGRNGPASGSSKLYTNDGAGTFTEMMGTPFEDVLQSAIAFADVDGDDDQDVLITGVAGFGTPSVTQISKLYTNDGTGVYTEVIGTPFEGVWEGSVAFADVDGDNDQDVLITGEIDSGPGTSIGISALYTNNGAGSFTKVMGTPFEDVLQSAIAFADVDGDNDQDVLITGFGNSSLVPISKLYTNDGVVSSIDDLITGGGLDFILFPNPSVTGRLNLNFEAADNGVVIIRIYNINGVLLKEKRERATIGQQTFSIDIESLPQGNYLLELREGEIKGLAKFSVQ